MIKMKVVQKHIPDKFCEACEDLVKQGYEFHGETKVVVLPPVSSITNPRVELIQVFVRTLKSGG